MNIKLVIPGFREKPSLQRDAKNLQGTAPGMNGHTPVGKMSTTAALPVDFWSMDEASVLNPPVGTSYEMFMDMFFNASHYVVMEGSKGNVHSHSYRLQIRCRSQSLKPVEHIIVGYQTLRERIRLVASAYNNQLLNNLPPFKHLQATTENLTAVLFQQLSRMLKDQPVELISITIWESPTEAITYQRDERNAGGAIAHH
jgi:6-pyruvoyl-tetrahydropterin synthase